MKILSRILLLEQTFTFVGFPLINRNFTPLPPMPFPLYLLCHCCAPAAAMLVRLMRDLTSRRQQPYSLFVWLVVGGCRFVLREKYC
jgi:hypothetical protein